MNKQDFLNNLTNALSGLPQDEVQKTIDYYCEIIDDAVEEGEEEQTVIARLGAIEDIAEKIIHETPLSALVTENIKGHKINIFTILLLIIGSPIWISLLLSVLAVLLSVYAAVWSIVIALFAVVAALALSGAALIITSPFLLMESFPKAMLAFGASLVCIGMSIFLFYLSVLCATLLIRFTVWTAQKIKHVFVKKGGETNEIQ